MRTFVTLPIKDGPRETIFDYNPDFSGDVHVRVRFGKYDYDEIRIPAQALLQFVSRCYVLPALIAELEDASTEDLLL
jgi:hypothetical protein